MAKDESNHFSWDEPPLPLHAQKSRRTKPFFQQLGLRHFMLGLIYFAILSWAGKRVFESDAIIAQVILGLLIGLGFCALGLWGVLKMGRFSFVGWIIFFIGYIGITVSTAGGFSLLMLPILIGCIIYLSLRRRSNHQDSVLWVLTVAADRGMPLDPGVRALSNQISGIFAVWTESLAELLRQGVALPDAIDSIPSIVPRGAALLIRMGSESGNLARGLREAVESRARQIPVYRSIISKIAYLFWVVFAGMGIVGFVMYFIIPKFEAIFKDFGVALPEVTVVVIRSSHVFIDYFWVPVLIFISVLISMLMNSSMGLGFGIPGAGRLFTRLHSILIMRALVVAVESRRPIDSTLDTLAEWYPTQWVRDRLRRTAVDVSRGTDFVESLRANGLITSIDAGVLTSAQRASNLAWALRELAETSERRWGYRLQLVTQFAFVLAILVLGALVFLIAVSYFLPLTTLITRLSQ